MQKQRAVTAYFSSKHLLLFAFRQEDVKKQTAVTANFLSKQLLCICICMLRGSTHYFAIAPRGLSHHIVDFFGGLAGWKLRPHH